MYDFALEDCTILHVKNVSIGVLENIENQKIFSPPQAVSPENCF